jgi:hypothetical protein
VVQSGIALASHAATFDDLVISCGVAGGLRPDLPTRTVLVPELVRRPDGSELECDAAAVQALCESALREGYRVVRDPLVTSTVLVHGTERAAFAAQGFAGVDMETGLLHAPRVACVRVILDTPLREISPAWGNPPRALLDVRAWRDLPFLMREGPRCAAVAARVAVSATKQLLVR